MDSALAAAWVTAAATALLALGVCAAALQVRATSKATKASLLMSFNTEFRQQDLYDSVIYLLDLRQEWIAAGGELENLAAAWVKDRAVRKSVNAQAREEWFFRRDAAQYLRHVGYLLHHGYLTPDDIFSTFPEAGRILEVVIPLENAIIRYYTSTGEVEPTAEWDRVGRKWELDIIMPRYLSWFEKNKSRSFGPHPKVPTRHYALPRHTAD